MALDHDPGHLDTEFFAADRNRSSGTLRGEAEIGRLDRASAGGRVRRGLHLLLEQTRAFVPWFEKRSVLMSQGTIKKVVSDRGFGFIQAEDGKEYFFHRSGMDSSLNFDALTGGERVSFEIEASQKGPRANRVRMV